MAVLKLRDSDTGESQMDVVENYNNNLSIQVGWAEGAEITVDMVEAEYISVILNKDQEDQLFEFLSERRIARSR